MIDRECRESNGQAVMITATWSFAALSAAPSAETSEFLDDFDRVAGPVSPTFFVGKARVFGSSNEFLLSSFARCRLIRLLPRMSAAQCAARGRSVLPLPADSAVRDRIAVAEPSGRDLRWNTRHIGEL